jgi:DNA-directed RNA polymerase subunit RPC12/RpoP
MTGKVIYQCVRCFTKYCIECEGSDGGKVCPQCGMGARLILQEEKKDA